MRIEYGELSTAHWLMLAIATAALAYFEGYRALQRRFVPAVVTRALEISARPSTRRLVLAPLYTLGLIGGRWRDLARGWAGVAAIVVAVALVRGLAEPWHGLLDAAVAVALAWGLVAFGIAVGRSIQVDRATSPRS
jgi:hypothetical protein